MSARVVHQPLERGDRIGDRTVRMVLTGFTRPHVTWRCVCGAEGTSDVHNFRRSTGVCGHKRKQGAA